MFGKRLMAMCPESKKYIVGNIFCQWIELMMNALMIYIIAGAVGKLYRGEMTAKGFNVSLSDVSFSYDGAKKVLSNADEILTMEGGRIS